jgi:putative transposase
MGARRSFGNPNRAEAMARRPRFDLPGIPSHVVQRGNDRRPCFRDDDDRRDYLRILRESSIQHGVDIHAHVLMDNHVHLLVSTTAPGATSLLMQSLGATYVRHFNDRHGRTGTLWEGRFHSCPVEPGPYLWNCHRYIELNPVRAGIVATPDGYVWSSFGFNALGHNNGLTTPRFEYRELGTSDWQRRQAYRAMFGSSLSDDEVREIRAQIRQERPLGGAEFLERIESATGIAAIAGTGGRPRLSRHSTCQKTLL